MKVFARGLLITAIPLVLQLSFTARLTGELNKIYDEVEAVFHSREVAGRTLELVRTILSEYYTLNMNCEIEGSFDEDALNKTRLEIGGKLAEMRGLLDGRPGQEENSRKLTRVAGRFAEVIDWAQREQKLGMTHWKKVDEQCYTASYKALTEFFAVASQIIQQEEGHADYSAILPRVQAAIYADIWLGLALCIGLAAYLSKLYGDQISSPIAHLLRQSKKIAEGAELEKALKGNDEFASLDRRLYRVAAALRELMARERELIRDSSEAICSLTANGKICSANAAAARLFMTAQRDLIGTNITDLLSSQCGNTALAALEQARGGDRRELLKVVSASGVVLDTQWNLSWSPEDRLILCVISDLTDEMALLALKQDFFDFIARSIVLPLEQITNELDDLRSSLEETNSDSLIELDRARRTARRIHTMAVQLLDFKQLDGGRLQLHWSEADLGVLSEQACELLAQLVADKGLTISVRGSSGPVDCDPERILQVILNLLSNAVKYSPQNSLIEISLRKAAQEVELAVTDSGPGLKEDGPAALEKIFEPFQQLENSVGGAGLGLAISRMIVHAHGGRTWAEARQGMDGTVFSFRLPCRRMTK